MANQTTNISIRMDVELKAAAEALLEAERIAKDSSVKGFHDVEALFEDLDSCQNIQSSIRINLKKPISLQSGKIKPCLF